MNWTLKFNDLKAKLQGEGIGVETLEDSWWLPRLAGKRGAAGFTFGKTIYITKWYWGDYAAYATLCHEAAHARDMKKYGTATFLLSYILLLPFVVTMRAFWEWRGYRENIRMEFRESGDVREATVDWVVSSFTSPLYLWMFPFPGLIRKLCNKEIARLKAAG